MNVEIIKRIISEKKTTLPSFSIHEWRTVKLKTGKINDLLTNIPTNNIKELNDLIYAGAKLVCRNVGSAKDHKQKVKSLMGNQVGNVD